jgi:hypothetical protein
LGGIDVNAIMRLRGASAALSASFGGASAEELLAGEQAVVALIQAVGQVLRDEALMMEFNTLASGADHGGMTPTASVRARAALIDGWLQGLIDSLTFTARLEAEAAAYAEARVKAERPIGFTPGQPINE